ncbi:hypothetical protein [Nocardioides sp.]|uniref:hypothetical protein n=1 Tax=Nocardioides sp. TaxID=35761 RepID=UPI003513CFA6
MKVMIALAGADHDVLLARGPALGALGVTAAQVNLDDAPVAGALRFPGPGTPEPGWNAIVSLTWPQPPAEEVLAVALASVSATAAHHAAWEVEERAPLSPAPTVPGERLDALANLALLRRPVDLPEAEWRQRWQVDHTPVAIATQGTSGYLQNRVLRPLTAQAPAVAALVEEHFPMAALTDVHAFYGSGGDDAELASRIERLMASCARFGADRDLDLVPTSRYLLPLA